MICLVNRDECCGCTACYAICPQNAIVMTRDIQGFPVPQLNKEKCIGCGLCYKVCPARKKIVCEHKNYYAVKNTDDNVREESSSGGISSEICRWIILNGGVVYGVQYDHEFNVITKRAVSNDECRLFRGSKYVQTDEKNTFQQAAKDLKEGRWVAFFSTSCHINGLLNYLHCADISITKLITIDLICHGVPSPLIFEDYIRFLNSNKMIKQYDFRTKENGWGNGSWDFGCRIKYQDGTREIDTLKSRIFLNLFFRNYCLNPRCYSCIYAGHGRAADITIADFWGIKEEIPQFYDSKGVSLVMVQNEKGQLFIDELERLNKIKITRENAERKQANMHNPSPRSEKYEQFWIDYETKGFNYIMKKYGDYSIKGKVKYRLKKILYGICVLK